MGLLSEVKNFIKTDILGITNKSDTTVKPAKTPVIQCQEPGKNEDVVQISDNKTPKPAPKNLGQIKQSIEMKCRANGINYMGIRKIFSEVAGVSQEQFEQLSEEEKINVFKAVDHTIDKTIELQKKYGASAQTSTTGVIKASAHNAYEAISTGSFENFEEFDKEVGDVNAELGEDFKKVEIKERRQRMDNLAKRRKARFEARLQERLNKLPENERAAAEQKMRSQYRFTERARFHEAVAANDSETGLHAITMLGAEDMNYGMTTVLETRCNKAEATRTADMANFDFTESLLASYHARGEKASAETVKAFTETNVSAKSAQAVTQYQEDYNTRRRAYENGEDVPPYMNEEIFTATAQGIGEGALNNVNMTAAEKAEFITKWENDAKQYNDYETVTKSVKESLETKPEYKDIKRIKKELETEQKETKTDKTAKITSLEKSEDIKVSKEVQTEISYNKSEPKAEQKNVNTTTNPIVQTKSFTPVIAAQDIQKNGVKKAIEKYGHTNVIEIILDNQNLKHLRPQLTAIIKSYDLQSLKKLTKDCSMSSFVYICSIVNDDFIQELKDERPDLCYSARKQIEKMEEKDAAY